MIDRRTLLKTLDDGCVIYTELENFTNIKSRNVNNTWHISGKTELHNVFNGNTGRLMSDLSNMDIVYIKSDMLIFTTNDKSSTIGIPL